MKNAILPGLLLAATLSQAQPVLLPNGDFENWTTISYHELVPWSSSNEYTVPQYGVATVLRVAGISGSYAVRMETKAFGTDTTAGYIANSDGDIEAGEGGAPFNHMVTQFKGGYRCNIPNGDTAFILLMFKKNGAVISDSLYPITGNQTTFASFSFNIPTMSVAPDSVIIAAVSGNALNSTPVAGGWLELDALSADDGLTLYPLPDGDFETWNSINNDVVSGWNDQGAGEITKTSDKYSGSYAVKLVSKDDGSGGVDPAILGVGTTQQPGMAFTKKVDTLTGYYKYSATGNDKPVIMIMAYDGSGMPIGTPITQALNKAAAYTSFDIPMSFSATPATIQVTLMSSDFSGTPKIGSTFIVDDLKFKNTQAGGAVNDINKGNIFSVYPNPAHGQLSIKSGVALTQPVEVHLYDITGKTVGSFEFAAFNTIQVSIADLTPGIYQYTIKCGELSGAGKFVKE